MYSSLLEERWQLGRRHAEVLLLRPFEISHADDTE